MRDSLMKESSLPFDDPLSRDMISRMSALRTHSPTVCKVCSFIELYRPWRYHTLPATITEMAARQMAVIVLKRFMIQIYEKFATNPLPAKTN